MFLLISSRRLRVSEYIHAARTASATVHDALPLFTAPERRRLARFYGLIAVLHVAGWTLYLHYASAFPALVGLGLVAYLFGLRHAFDADHIAAIDDSVRYLLQKGRGPLGTGFFFSLGHSTIVIALTIGIAFAAAAFTQGLPELKNFGSAAGAVVSGMFLWLIGVLNFLLLLDFLGVWRKAKAGAHDHRHLEQLLQGRGLINRLFGGRIAKVLSRSWQMYPLGLLFGLGFDTASEIGLLAMTAGASVGNLPLPAVISLPILFAAGMTLMDTTDGVLMTKAYDWALVNPLRKIFYNLTTTALSIAVALGIGTIELAQVLIGALELHGQPFDTIAGLDFGVLGYVIVALFLGGWGLSIALWKLGRIEHRHGHAVRIHTHARAHEDGLTHVPRHVH